jgi:fumarylacetoacetate (FAA) hydrolase
MKLASLRAGGRDGTLIVVNRGLTHAIAATDIAPTLQYAIENWDVVSPKLLHASERLNGGAEPGSFPLVIDDLASPLPRSYQFLDGSVYLHHMEKARKARGAAMPSNYKTEPLMYQGLSDRFCGPREPMRLPSDALDADYEAEVAVIVDDVPMGTTAANASKHIKLVLLMNDFTLRALTRTELPKGFGFLQAKPTSAFSPVAVTPDELGEAWDGSKLSLPILSEINGRRVGRPNAGIDMFFTYPDLIAHAARTRALGAGTIIGAGAVSNQDEDSGFGCIAEARIHEEGLYGKARTDYFKFGDVIRIDMLDAGGRSIFGAIEQSIQPSIPDS